MIRARETTDIINEELELPVEYTKTLREMNNGKLAGMLNDDAEKMYPGIYFSTLDMDEKYPNGESPREFYNRVKKDFEKLINDNKEFENILFVTHSGVINIIYHIVKNLEWSNKEKRFKIENGSIHRIRIKDNCISDIEKIKI